MRFDGEVQLGPYQLLGPIGSGGMGEVYRARDTRLDRIVAVKILRPAGADQDRRHRFEREARAVAALNHPHICNILDVGESPSPDGHLSGDAVRFLVMEHLEGHTLAERLLRGPLPLKEAMQSAIEIADALDHAHRRGLVHRDLKPSNVMLTETGAKLLDFGLSKLQPPRDLIAMSTVATSEPPLTGTGAILGTYPYMAPEQLAGRAVDARSDIFAFGALLYEMIGGRRAFAGATTATVIGAVLHADPAPLSAVVPHIAPALEQIVARCLAKDPDCRWQSARDLRFELESVRDPPATAAPQAGGWIPFRYVLGVIGLLATAALVLVVANRVEPAAESAVVLELSLPGELTLVDPSIAGPIAIAPDSRTFAVVAMDRDGRQRLFVRALDSLGIRPVAGSEGAQFPFWSPDGRVIAFFAQRRLKRVAAAGGLPQVVCEATLPRGGTMNRDGVIVFAAEAGRRLYRVSASGGSPTPLPADGVNDERYWPSFLPDGRHFVYFGRPGRHGVYLAQLENGQMRLLLEDRVSAVYAAGHLLTLGASARRDTAGPLVAYPFDATRLQVTGEPRVVADAVPYHSGVARAAFSVSERTLLYGQGLTRSKQLVWFDRTGRQLGALGQQPGFLRPSISPDASTVAVQGVERNTQQADIWLLDAALGRPSRLTATDAFEDLPIWSPDGSRIVYSSPRGNRPPNLYQKAVSGSGDEQMLLEPDTNHKPTDWSRDGRFVVYASLHPTRQWDLWLLPMDGSRVPIPYLRSEFNEHLGRVSPDGRWLAYVSDESGTDEVYVQAFPVAGAKQRISSAGGSEPAWRADGRELYYRAIDGSITAVGTHVTTTLEVGPSLPLFKPRTVDDWTYDINYAVTPDGRRFLVNVVDEGSRSAPTIVMLDWGARIRP